MKKDLRAEVTELRAQVDGLCYERAVIVADLESQIRELRERLGDRDRVVECLIGELRAARGGQAPPPARRRPRLRVIQGASAAAVIAAGIAGIAGPAITAGPGDDVPAVPGISRVHHSLTA